jgi:hypothetical protein
MEDQIEEVLSRTFPNQKFKEKDLKECEQSLIYLAKAIHLFALQEKEDK